jgi:hypothetical protein
MVTQERERTLTCGGIIDITCSAFFDPTALRVAASVAAAAMSAVGPGRAGASGNPAVASTGGNSSLPTARTTGLWVGGPPPGPAPAGEPAAAAAGAAHDGRTFGLLGQGNNTEVNPSGGSQHPARTGPPGPGSADASSMSESELEAAVSESRPLSASSESP